jgi:REP element-mobilizing transposase RayT
MLYKTSAFNNNYLNPNFHLTKIFYIMPYNPAIHNRHSIRLSGYDYAQPGAYFLTINTHKKEHLFGRVVDGVVQLSPVGEIAQEQWLKIPDHFSNVVLDAFVIMPNHLHGILLISEGQGGHCKGKAFDHFFPKNMIKCFTRTARVAESNAFPERLGSQSGSIPAVVQNFKSITSRKINKLLETPGSTIWHRNYYEHVIRDEEDYDRIVGYIRENPRKWEG